MAPVKLNLAKIIFGAVVFSWHRRAPLSRALIKPLLGILAVEVYRFYSYGLSGVWDQLSFLVYWIFAALFAVRCHRVILTEAKTEFKFAWTAREMRFLGWLLILILIEKAVASLTAFFIAAVFSPVYVKAFLPDLAAFFSLIYVFGRVCLILPAAALDRRPTIKWAWNLSVGNGWKLAFIFALLRVAGFLMIEVRKDADIANLIFMGLIIYVSLPVISIASLSLSYKELAKTQIKVITASQKNGNRLEQK